jgi:hypothetical protein
MMDPRSRRARARTFSSVNIHGPKRILRGAAPCSGS